MPKCCGAGIRLPGGGGRKVGPKPSESYAEYLLLYPPKIALVYRLPFQGGACGSHSIADYSHPSCNERTIK